ncbi:MAG TPA: CHRD domain-containing protein [Vicinamibacterales bacterium]|nr:CHRD domain-containing protein [Vicinamibacterales bacterium]
MRRLVYLPFLLAIAATGCDDSPIEPSPDTIPTFTAALTPANEVPPVTSVESVCSGNVTIRVTNLTRNSSQVITAAKVDFTGNVTGCAANTSINLGHIHEAAAGLNGNIVVDTGLAAGQFVLVTGAGSFARTGRDPQGGDFTIIQRMLDNPGSFYFNLHSTLHPNGVIRGQLVRTQ